MDWISVEDRLPDFDELVIICLDNGEYCLGHLTKQRYGNPIWTIKDFDCYGMPVYWTPVPKLSREMKDYLDELEDDNDDG